MGRIEPGAAARRPRVQKSELVTRVVGLYRGKEPSTLSWRVQGRPARRTL